MSRIFHNIEVPLDQSLEDAIRWRMPSHGEIRILRKSVDARRRHEARWVYSVEVAEAGEQLPLPTFAVPRLEASPSDVPIVVGAGPAGLFAALRLVERGIKCRLFEQGSEAGIRIKGINQYWRYGKLDPKNNVCFGEGGAGLYSDGKLITRIKSPEIPYVMQRLVQFGAPAEIQYLSNPHVGSDRIRRVIPKMREFLKAQGCEIHFDTEISEILFQNRALSGVRTQSGQTFSTHHLVLATGHSSVKILEHLYDQNVTFEGKSFAMGLRVEHPQNAINKIQYRQFADHPELGAANYRLAHHDKKSGIGVYSFCMCPGGYVLASGTEPNGVVSNGMSNYHRNSPFANSAVVVTVDHALNFKDTFGGMKLRTEIEQAGYRSVLEAGGQRELPAQSLYDFLNEKTSPVRTGSSLSGAIPVRLDQLLPKQLRDRLKEGLQVFDQSMKGFLSQDAVLYGMETRTSCPVRITRDSLTLQSVSHSGLYPCGEGAGYAGGITSAACDGIKVAEAIVKSLVANAEPTPWTLQEQAPGSA